MSLLLTFLSLRGTFGVFDDAVFGLILVGIMLFAPEGLLALEPRRLLAAARSRFGGRDEEEAR
jgi:branched-chain amino acid transport system permease protein